jgi:hypothetical protein
LLLFFGLIIRRPTGIKIIARMMMNATMTHIKAFRFVHLRLVGASSAANGQAGASFSAIGANFSGSDISGSGRATRSVGSTKGFA